MLYSPLQRHDLLIRTSAALHLALRVSFPKRWCFDLQTMGMTSPYLSESLSLHSVSCGFHDAEALQVPLEDRAWCFQERILSTRIVHHTNGECNGPNECECGVMQCEMQEPTLREYFRALLGKESPDRAEIWMELITKCSKRKLTFESDRIPAISGLAKSLQERGFGEYLARKISPDSCFGLHLGQERPRIELPRGHSPLWRPAASLTAATRSCHPQRRCTCKFSRPALSPLGRIREVLCATALYKSLVPCNLGLSSGTT
jgi:hypothetical protein